MFWLLSLLLFLIICIITITIITTIILVIIVIFCIPIVLLLLLPLLFSLLYPQCIPWLSPMCEMWDSISTPEIDRFATSQNLDSDWSVAKPSRILVVLSLMRCVFFSKHILTLCYELWLNSSMIVVWWNSQRLVHHGLITLSISYLQLSTIILKYHIKFIILIRYRINIYIYQICCCYSTGIFPKNNHRQAESRRPGSVYKPEWIVDTMQSVAAETPWITVEADGNGAKSYRYPLVMTQIAMV